MDESNKNISVDDILREYQTMSGQPPQESAYRPLSTTMENGDQVWRPAQNETGYDGRTDAGAYYSGNGGNVEPVMVHAASDTGRSARKSGKKGGKHGREQTVYRESPRVYNPNAEREAAQQGSDPNKNKKKKKGTGKKAAVAVVTVVVLGAGAALGYTYATGTVFHGVTAGTVEVGGLSLTDAKTKIEQEVGKVLESGTISVNIEGNSYPIAVKDVTQGVDAQASAQAAFDIGHTGNMMERVSGAFGALLGQKSSDIVVKLDNDALNQKLDEIASQALTEPTKETWTLDGTNLILTMPKPGVSFDQEKVKDDIYKQIESMNFTPYEVETQLTDPEPLNVDTLKAEVDCEATNAIVDKTDGKTIIPEQPGIQMDVEQAKQIIGDGSQETYTIPVTVTPAKVTKEVLDRALFRDVLASTSTRLNTGNADRTSNVTLAAKNMNGTILNPGEEFSYNGVVGPRTAERGFKAAGAYSNGQLIDEVGGGVCQPSSTLYMAVLRADLEVTERSNHSMTVAYTPLGQDATVSYGSLDFKFKNNTDYPIKLVTVREGSEMKVTILGTKVDDKTVRLETDVLETLEPQTVEKTDSSLSPGEKKVEQSAVTGYKTITYKYVTVNGQTTKEVANRSSYRKRDKVVLVGPEAPAKTPATTPSSGTSSSSSTSSTESSSSGAGNSSSSSTTTANTENTSSASSSTPSDPES